MHKNAWLLFFLVISFVLVWILVIPRTEWSQATLKGLGSTVAVTGYAFFSLSLFLSSRLKKLEDWFGGLDHVYKLHHRLGLWGFWLLVLHPVVLALKWFPQNLGHFFLFFLPAHHRVSVNLGSYAFWLMLLIICITIFKLLPYDKWKWVHKGMSVVFLLASLHFLLSKRRFDPSTTSLVLLCFPFAIGLFGILYKQVYLALCQGVKYQITSVEKLSDAVLRVTLESEQKGIDFVPGQYAFFSFNHKLSSEQHPFTICSMKGKEISILAKVRGDFTRTLYDQLEVGSEAKLEGPYGRFDFTRGSQDQIWIAGGIGIAPFLAWEKRLQTWQGKIKLFYCCHRKVDTFFIRDLKRMQANSMNFSFYLYCTENQEHLTVEAIQAIEKDLMHNEIYMCGPQRLTHSFARSFQEAGVSQKRIHFEDFEFF